MATEITPPGSFVEPPLTPPLTKEKVSSRSTQRVLNCFKLYRVSHRPQFWWQHLLALDDYRGALQMLNSNDSLRDYVEDKVR